MSFSSILYHKIGDSIVDSWRRPWGRRRMFPEETICSSNPRPFLVIAHVAMAGVWDEENWFDLADYSNLNME